MSETQTSFRWYVVQARVNAEKSVAEALRGRIVQFNLQSEFGDVLVPSEELVELRNGQKRKSDRKFFPGYVLVQIATNASEGIPRISSEAWHLVRETSKVTGFIGGTAERPLPISDKEADKILSRVEQAEAKPTLKSNYEKGQTVRIVEGPFNDFNGVVVSADPDKAVVRVAVLVFGRATEVDFAVNQVEAAAAA